MKSGFVGIIGRPNVGKSTLLNALIGEKISIISAKAQTTRNAIIGVFNDDDSQIVFTDTPGVHQAKNQLGNFMNREAFNQIDGVDLVYYLFDGTKSFKDEDERILDYVFKVQERVFLLITKIDLISKEKLIKLITYLADKYSFSEIIPISSIKYDNLDELIKTTKNYLNDDLAYYDTVTNVSDNFRIAEIVREKILNNFYQEIPHQLATVVENVRYTDKRAFISVLIIVGKDSHKSIIIGKGGTSLKKINYESSKDLKVLLNKKVFLSLHVKVDRDWFNNENKLTRYGFSLKMQDE